MLDEIKRRQVEFDNAVKNNDIETIRRLQAEYRIFEQQAKKKDKHNFNIK